MNVRGKCPGCGLAASVAYKPGDARQKFGTGQLMIVAYVCSSCDTILGVETDPLAMISDISERVAKRLGARPQR
jgi:hypothetical protein